MVKGGRMDNKADLVNDEPVIWTARPSQITNLWPFIICFLLIALIIVAALMLNQSLIAIAAILPLAFAFWKWLALRCRVYELTTQRIRLYEGVLNQDIDDIELYRIKDTKILRPFWLRFFGLSNLVMESSDRSHPRVTFQAVSNGLGIREQVRKYVEIQRDKKRVREVDYEGDDGFEIE